MLIATTLFNKDRFFPGLDGVNSFEMGCSWNLRNGFLILHGGILREEVGCEVESDGEIIDKVDMVLECLEFRGESLIGFGDLERREVEEVRSFVL